jgi:hypothetical protein
LPVRRPAWTGICASFPRSSNFFHSHGTHDYDIRPVFHDVDENPDNLPDLGITTATLRTGVMANETVTP